MKTAKALITIDESLRLFLFGLQARLRVWFDGQQIEAIFTDAIEDQVSAKSYGLLLGGAVEVMGEVDEYEPETVRIIVKSSTVDQGELDEIVEKAKIDMARRSGAATGQAEEQEPKMSKIYEVRSTARNDGKTHYWGAKRSRADAEALLASRSAGEKKEWADKHHDRWWIEEIDTTGMFEIPSPPTPRERFSTEITKIKSPKGAWDALHVDVLNDAMQMVGSYDRNYPNMLSGVGPGQVPTTTPLNPEF